MLAGCLRSIADAGGIDHLIVVDNGGSAAVPAGIELVRTTNVGYGAAANVGFARALAAGASVVALLNDDITVTPGWAGPLVDALGEPRVGAAQPKLLVSGTQP